MKVNPELCLFCGCCAGSCPKNAIFIEETRITFNEYCIHCGLCIKACPIGAINND